MNKENFSIELENFKSFKDKSSIEIKPLTLIYGLNQSGKSIALRSIGLVSDSIFNENGAIDISSPTLRGDTFSSIGYFGSKTPAIKISTNSGSIKLKFSTADNLPESNHVVGDEFIVNDIIVTNSENTPVYEATFDKIKEIFENNYIATYNLEGNKSDSLIFRSFLPAREDENPIPCLAEIKTSLNFLSRCQWIQASRVVSDIWSANAATARCCNPSGFDLVYRIKGQQQDAIIEKTNEWLNKEFKFTINIKTNEAGHRFLAIKHNTGGKEISLEKSSEGIKSIIPIILCCYWAQIGQSGKSKNSPLIILIEEPESHLHPNTQINFFSDVIVELVKSGIYITLETHSVYILRSLQKSILNGSLNSNDVSLNWVEKTDGSSTIKHIKIRNDSTLENWRPDIYEEEQKLSLEIINARLKNNQCEE